jgi:DNA polymerase-3 subunit delta'
MADELDEVGGGNPPPESYAVRYFWHDKAWSALVRDFSVLPHALLFHGIEGLGKSALAWQLAKSLLCKSPVADAMACGICPSCMRYTAGTHPDLKNVTPLGDSRVISVDQIREVGQFSTLTPHTAKRKIILLDPAEAMNTSAANAFLKVLEEPPPSCSLLLVTSHAARLPATIRSRCVAISAQPPRREEAAAWLQSLGVDSKTAVAGLNLAGGAPVRALELIRADELRLHDNWRRDVSALRDGSKDPLSCARQWKDYGIERCLGWFQRYVAELAVESASDLSSKRNRIFLNDLFRYSDVLSEARNLAAGPLDESLLLEDMTIRWSRLFHPVV